MQEDNPSDEEFAKRMAEGSKTPEDKLAEKAAEGDKPKKKVKAEKEAAPDYAGQVKELEDRLLRTMAEMQNLRNRTEKEIIDAQRFGITSFARDLISVLEHMYLAIGSIPQDKLENDPLFKNLHLGVKMTADELETAFRKHGIKRIWPEGEKFDHNFHQAMLEIPTSEKEPGSIVQVMQAGYTIYDRLIRPALVGVARAAPEQAEKESKKA